VSNRKARLPGANGPSLFPSIQIRYTGGRNYYGVSVEILKREFWGWFQGARKNEGESMTQGPLSWSPFLRNRQKTPAGLEIISFAPMLPLFFSNRLRQRVLPGVKIYHFQPPRGFRWFLSFQMAFQGSSSCG
jgi:hypothetical protein